MTIRNEVLGTDPQALAHVLIGRILAARGFSIRFSSRHSLFLLVLGDFSTSAPAVATNDKSVIGMSTDHGKAGSGRAG
jgi:hypothetical protein